MGHRLDVDFWFPLLVALHYDLWTGARESPARLPSSSVAQCCTSDGGTLVADLNSQRVAFTPFARFFDAEIDGLKVLPLFEQYTARSSERDASSDAMSAHEQQQRCRFEHDVLVNPCPGRSAAIPTTAQAGQFDELLISTPSPNPPINSPWQGQPA